MPPPNRGVPIPFNQTDLEPPEELPFDPYDMDTDDDDEYNVGDLLDGLTRVQRIFANQGEIVGLRDTQFINVDGTPFDPGPAVDVYGEPMLRASRTGDVLATEDRTSDESVSSDDSDLFDIYNAAVDAAGSVWAVAEGSALDPLEGYEEPPRVSYVNKNPRAADWTKAMEEYLDGLVRDGYFKPVTQQDVDREKSAKKLCFQATRLDWVFRYRKSSAVDGPELFKVTLADRSCRGRCYDTMMDPKKTMVNPGLICSYLAQQYGLTIYHFDVDVSYSQKPLDQRVEVSRLEGKELVGKIYEVSRNVIPGLASEPAVDTKALLKRIADLGFKSNNGELFVKTGTGKDERPVFLHVSPTNLLLVAHRSVVADLKSQILAALPATFLGNARNFGGWDILQTSKSIFLSSNKKLDSVLDPTALDTDRKKYMRSRSLRSPRTGVFLATASTAIASLASDLRPDMVCRATRLQHARALRSQGKLFGMLYRFLAKTSDMCMQLHPPQNSLEKAQLICYVSKKDALLGTAIFLDEYPLYWQADIVDESTQDTKEAIVKQVTDFYSDLIASWDQGQPTGKQVRSEEAMNPIEGWESVEIPVSENPAHLLVSKPYTEGFEKYQRLFHLDP